MNNQKPFLSANIAKSFLKVFAAMLVLMLYGNQSTAQSKQPNVIIILSDDLGYGDLACYGNPTIQTPNLDQMAHEGARLTQFYSAAPICTPGRAGLLTGCYPKRVGLHKGVLFPGSSTGLNPKEETLAELLKQEGYTTACIGKWHLGHHTPFMPLNQGFDLFYGFPYSNDMSRKEQLKMKPNSKYPFHLPWLLQHDTIALDPDQSLVTQKLTQKSLDFIKDNKKNRFFLYLAYPMPHIPLYASPRFLGTSARGLFGDVVSEIDHGVGEILKQLKQLKLDNNTLVVFTSDNGPWEIYKTHGGSAGPLRGAKGSTWEGGLREPGIFWYPGHIKKSRHITEFASVMDLLPTVVKMCNAPMPEARIDGRDISGLLLSGEKPEPKPFLYYSKKGEVQGIRQGAYKFLRENGNSYLFNIEEDISEKYDLKEEKPLVYSNLKTKMEEMDKQLTKEARAVGDINKPDSPH